MPKKLSHYDGSGRASMVDVSSKIATRREAEASAYVVLKPAVLKALASASRRVAVLAETSSMLARPEPS